MHGALADRCKVVSLFFWRHPTEKATSDIHPHLPLPDSLVMSQVRASVHYFNNEEDVDRLMNVLHDVVQGAAPWQPEAVAARN